MNLQKVYYAHSKQIYGTDQELQELEILRKIYRHVTCPNNDIGELGGIEPYLTIIRHHDVVICSEFKSRIGRGCYSEIKEALKSKKIVMTLRQINANKYNLYFVKDVLVHDDNDWKVNYGIIIVDKTQEPILVEFDVNGILLTQQANLR